jgi:hypothetical protein
MAVDWEIEQVSEWVDKAGGTLWPKKPNFQRKAKVVEGILERTIKKGNIEEKISENRTRIK